MNGWEGRSKQRSDHDEDKSFVIAVMVFVQYCLGQHLAHTNMHTFHLYLCNELSHIMLCSWPLLVLVIGLWLQRKRGTPRWEGTASLERERDCIYDGPYCHAGYATGPLLASQCWDTASFSLVLNCLMLNSRGQAHWILIWEMPPYSPSFLDGNGNATTVAS